MFPDRTFSKARLTLRQVSEGQGAHEKPPVNSKISVGLWETISVLMCILASGVLLSPAIMSHYGRIFELMKGLANELGTILWT